ncbi:MAG: YdcF family protein [Bacteroidales bacterium]|nr:YdcF family protein [Bacteroidales bacterium]
MRGLYGLLLVLLAVCCSHPAPFEGPGETVFRKNYPLTHALEKESALIMADSTLCALGQEKYRAFELAPNSLEAVERARFTEEEINVAGNRLAALATNLSALTASMRKQGSYFIFNELPDSAFLRRAWMQDSRGMNHVLDVYALGQAPRYPAIDGVAFPPEGTEMSYVRGLAWSNVLSSAKDGPFYAVALQSVLTWLDANGRFEAADFEPLGKGINAKAYKAIGHTRWDEYPYTVILALGCGPEREGEAISAQSRLRAHYAARLYKAGKAPFIVVSGGRVHPFRTPFSEAEEMKTYLMEVCGIPEQAIIAEPHARHTTTNLRNTARIMLQQGIPLDKPGLVTSGREHIDYVTGDGFQANCLREMLVVPFRLGARTSAREAEFYPLPEATQVTPLDPLDP